MYIWTDIERIDSEDGNVTKFVFTKENAIAEAVLYRYPTYLERTVICCSTQSGCAVGCRFCGAGDAFVRSLTDDEIISQVVHCISETGELYDEIRKLQIMFMSMGEPLMNMAYTFSAIRYLNIHYPNAALLLSTIGPRVHYEPLYKLSSEIDQIGLQFSIHESTDEERDRLIPFPHKLTLKEIALVGEEWNRTTDRMPYFNYCARDSNTSDCDADRIADLFDPRLWCCTISVVCERNTGMPSRNDHQITLAREFGSKMLDRGFDVRVFDPAGQDDIGGGCGQLWFVQEWIKENGKSIPSHGAGLPVIGSPSKRH